MQSCTGFYLPDPVHGISVKRRECKHQPCNLSVVREVSARPSRTGSHLRVLSRQPVSSRPASRAARCGRSNVQAYASAFVSSYLPLSYIAMASRLSSREDYADLLDKYDTWLFDCDGVLWSGDKTIDGAIEVLQLLRHHSAYSRPAPLIYYVYRGIEKSVLFVTNNATKSRVNYKKKFDSLGVEAHVVRLARCLRARSTRN